MASQEREKLSQRSSTCIAHLTVAKCTILLIAISLSLFTPKCFSEYESPGSLVKGHILVHQV